MSANRDRSEKITFVYSNLYQLYKQAKDAAIQAKPFETGHIIRKDDLNQSLRQGLVPGLKIERHRPSALVQTQALQGVHPSSERAVSDLKNNLKSLNDLQSRLNFMLKEIDDLLKPKK